MKKKEVCKEDAVPEMASQAHSSALLWSSGNKLSLEGIGTIGIKQSGSSLLILVSCFSVSTAFGLFCLQP